jgi:hypothetical protein
MPASRIFFFARTRRWPIVVGETRNAEPIAAASKPRIVWRINGARTVASIAGCAHANISARRSSGSCASSRAAASISSATSAR